jgi:hypothetical protein
MSKQFNKLLFLSGRLQRDDVDDYTIARHLEAYLLWLFGYVMFGGSREIWCRGSWSPVLRQSSTPRGLGPQMSWGAAILAATSGIYALAWPRARPARGFCSVVRCYCTSGRTSAFLWVGLTSSGIRTTAAWPWPNRPTQHGLVVVPTRTNFIHFFANFH